jgi:hypothetical protein
MLIKRSSLGVIMPAKFTLPENSLGLGALVRGNFSTPENTLMRKSSHDCACAGSGMSGLGFDFQGTVQQITSSPYLKYALIGGAVLVGLSMFGGRRRR